MTDRRKAVHASNMQYARSGEYYMMEFPSTYDDENVVAAVIALLSECATDEERGNVILGIIQAARDEGASNAMDDL